MSRGRNEALYVALCLAHIGLATADYACVCNYKQTVTVYSKDSTQSTPLGNLTGWGCKAILSMSVASQWYPLAFQHQVGYVQADPQVLMQMCVGDVPTDDVITSARTIPTTTTATSITSPNSTTSTTRMTTTSMQTSTEHQTSTAPTDPPTTTKAREYSHQSMVDGNLALCPGNMAHEQAIYHDVIGQFRNKCFALSLADTFTWDHANSICHAVGATLVQIENDAEQAFITSFVQRHTPHSPVWLGLNDRIHEGHWHWNAGTGDSGYRNWNRKYHEDHSDRFEEDCVILMPGKQGTWDDVRCGAYLDGLGLDIGPTHHLMCQWFIPHTNAILG